jgi:hypothetical protein
VTRVFVFLSALFVTLTLFTGRQSVRMLILELQYAREALTDNRNDAPNGSDAQLRRE